MQAKKRRKSESRRAALDIGSSKIACMIVEHRAASGDGAALADALVPHVLGIGYQRSQGIKGGVVLDPAKAEDAIRAAVDKAERLAGLTIDDVHVSINAGRLRSHNYGAMLETAGARIKDSHVDVLHRKGWQHLANEEDAILHAQPIDYALDGATGLEHPKGYRGRHLFADFHAVSADMAQIRQHLSCIEDSYLSPASVIAAPYASALATIRPNEAHEGVMVLDLGGGTSSLAIFVNHRFVFASSLAKGGQQISAALARRFKMSVEEAERLKLHIGRQLDDRHAYPKAHELMERQLMGIFLHEKQKIQDAGFPLEALRYVVLTGGGALYYDAPRLAAQVFGLPTRVGLPKAVSGLPPQLVNPAFSALWGIIAYQTQKPLELADRFAGPLGKSVKGSFSRLGSWLHQLTD